MLFGKSAQPRTATVDDKLRVGRGLIMRQSAGGTFLSLSPDVLAKVASGSGGVAGAVPGVLQSASLDNGYAAYIYTWSPVTVHTTLGSETYEYEVLDTPLYAVYLEDFNAATSLQTIGSVRMMFLLPASDLYVFA